MTKINIIKELKSQKKQYKILAFVLLFLLIGSAVLSVQRGIKRDEYKREVEGFKEIEIGYIDEIIEKDKQINNLTDKLYKLNNPKRLWTCSLEWTCSDSYTWIDKDYLNEQGWDYADYDYPPQKTALSVWAWSLPMEFEIDNTGTYRECTADVIDCFELNSSQFK